MYCQLLLDFSVNRCSNSLFYAYSKKCFSSNATIIHALEMFSLRTTTASKIVSNMAYFVLLISEDSTKGPKSKYIEIFRIYCSSMSGHEETRARYIYDCLRVNHKNRELQIGVNWLP